jgi:predicted PurR-regulated permease PerM
LSWSGLSIFFYYEVKDIITTVPDLDGKIQNAEKKLLGWFSGLGMNVSDKSFDLNYLTSKISENSGLILSFAGGVGGQLGKVFLVLLYSFFIIFYKDTLAHFYELRTENEKKLESAKLAVKNVVGIIGSYLSGILIITTAMAVMLYILFIILGLEYALFWALFIGALSVIPYIGIPIGIVLVAVFSFLTHDVYYFTLLVVGAILLANVVQENVLRPLIVGDKLKLSAFMVFFSVMLGGLFGVSQE